MADPDIVAHIDGLKREVDRVRIKADATAVVVESVIACLHNEGILSSDKFLDFLGATKTALLAHSNGLHSLGALADELEQWLQRLSPD